MYACIYYILWVAALVASYMDCFAIILAQRHIDSREELHGIIMYMQLCIAHACTRLHGEV